MLNYIVVVVCFFFQTVIAGSDINVTLTITSESCIDGKYNQFLMLSKKLNEVVKITFYWTVYVVFSRYSISFTYLFMRVTFKFSFDITYLLLTKLK